MTRSIIPQECFDKVLKFFNGDQTKTWLWFQTINPSLGGFSPLDMIKKGRVKKLKLFIDNSMAGIFP